MPFQQVFNRKNKILKPIAACTCTIDVANVVLQFVAHMLWGKIILQKIWSNLRRA